ncbi:hypothetical protein K443DRAFT_93910 [Laccaria amethystina LaAM-08-1]|uniref:Uncharacterized protein n=1 Tax=Laccaria amethystina LaAM-08-1 TaxID=1095629 RepID=A0A0C9Y7Q2_9AGAR|nr:hypothetical protein K443DRAFT_93910 [Laccaria amethystina LaAM-08-1]
MFFKIPAFTFIALFTLLFSLLTVCAHAPPTVPGSLIERTYSCHNSPMAYRSDAATINAQEWELKRTDRIQCRLSNVHVACVPNPNPYSEACQSTCQV